MTHIPIPFVLAAEGSTTRRRRDAYTTPLSPRRFWYLALTCEVTAFTLLVAAMVLAN